ncbi:hypothetical protein [Autumnicola musiva]|uniref:DNA-binding protein n=1 Tax=Autumnicola musiva TaxID=3075589 RepID=A0ABU3D4Z9_9FLAO|nr:hypothetical protein [Zunongwangia sp. F117]MDT0676618.1 hypothetical protein [Zunongwangia sp. F117]
MEISKDAYFINLLKDGIGYTEVIRNSSKEYWDKLIKNNLVKIDALGKVYLTDKGKVARLMGIEEYLRAEKLEKEMTEYSLKKLKFQNKLLSAALLCLFLMLLYIIFENNFSF